MTPIDDKLYMEKISYFMKIKQAGPVVPPGKTNVKIPETPRPVSTMGGSAPTKVSNKKPLNVKGTMLKKAGLLDVAKGAWEATKGLGKSTELVGKGLKAIKGAGKVAPKIRKFDPRSVYKKLQERGFSPAEAAEKMKKIRPESRIAHLEKQLASLKERGRGARKSRTAAQEELRGAKWHEWEKKKGLKGRLKEQEEKVLRRATEKAGLKSKLKRHKARQAGSITREQAVAKAKEKGLATLKEGLKRTAHGAAIPAAGLYAGKKILDKATEPPEPPQYI